MFERLGVLHCDLGESNVMVSAKDHAQGFLLGWGLSELPPNVKGTLANVTFACRPTLFLVPTLTNVAQICGAGNSPMVKQLQMITRVVIFAMTPRAHMPSFRLCMTLATTSATRSHFWQGIYAPTKLCLEHLSTLWSPFSGRLPTY